MQHSSTLAFTAIVTLALSCHAEDKTLKVDREINLSAVSFAEFEKAVAYQKDKIVVVDVWSNYCVPCKKKFPHFVEMAAEYTKLGVAFFTLNIDEADQSESILQYLKDNKAEFPNFRIEDTDENKASGTKRIEFEFPPIIHIFDRSGKLVKSFEGKDKDADVEKYIKDLAKRK